jgi:hypothetical protein
VNVVGVRLKAMLFASVLIVVGLALFFYGTSMGNHLMKPESLISGTYLVVLGIFLALAGFLMLLLQLFQRHSVIY